MASAKKLSKAMTFLQRGNKLVNKCKVKKNNTIKYLMQV